MLPNLQLVSAFHLIRIPMISRLTRSYSNRAASRTIPSPRGCIESPVDFLKAIGRESDVKLEIQEWDKLWQTDRVAMKKAGLDVQGRRYILWCMEKYRQGFDIKDFAHETKPKKKIRGRGPSVQFGKRIRSRRET